MKYTITMLFAAILSSCAGMEYHPENVDPNAFNRAAQQWKQGTQGNTPQNCTYWSDVAGMVHSTCQ